MNQPISIPKPTNILSSTISNVTNMKETTVVSILTGFIIVTLIISLGYYFYMKNLPRKECSFFDSVYGNLEGSIRSIDSNNPDFGYTFKDYYIKTAYNACSPGNYKNDYVNICALKDVIKQGVRGLDFEIYSLNDQPVVATSTSDSYYVKETYNYVNFGDVLNTIKTCAFASSTAPNPQDPIILHLRFKSTNQNMFQNLANMLESYNSYLMDKSYSYENQGTNFGDTLLTDMLGKIAIIVDKSNTAFVECKDLMEYVNMTSNSIFMRALNYYDIQNNADITELMEFNKRGMTIALPDKGSAPSNPSGIVVRQAGCQMIAMRYQQIDSNLEESDLLFAENGYAFVLKPDNLRYEAVVIDDPEPQNPAVSYETRTVKTDYYEFQI